MSSSQQKLWHCLITNTETMSGVVKFYNKFGLDLIPLDKRDKKFYVSSVAPLIILEENENQGKSLLMWPQKICPQFKNTFPQIQQVLGFENLANVEVPNACNFNRYIPFKNILIYQACKAGRTVPILYRVASFEQYQFKIASYRSTVVTQHAHARIHQNFWRGLS